MFLGVMKAIVRNFGFICRDFDLNIFLFLETLRQLGVKLTLMTVLITGMRCADIADIYPRIECHDYLIRMAA